MLKCQKANRYVVAVVKQEELVVDNAFDAQVQNTQRDELTNADLEE